MSQDRQGRLRYKTVGVPVQRNPLSSESHPRTLGALVNYYF